MLRVALSAVFEAVVSIAILAAKIVLILTGEHLVHSADRVDLLRGEKVVAHELAALVRQVDGGGRVRRAVRNIHVSYIIASDPEENAALQLSSPPMR